MALISGSLTKEKHEQIERVYKDYRKKVFISLGIHIGMLFVANLVSAVVNILFLNDSQFLFLMSIGSAMIVTGGFLNSTEKLRDIFIVEMEKISKKD